MGTTALDDAREALRQAGSDPARAVGLAGAATRRARRESDAEAAAVAEQAWGHATLYRGDMANAARHLRRSIEHGRRAGSDALAAEARMTLSYALAQQGRLTAALTEIDRAVRVLDGIAGARAHSYRGMVLRLASRPAEALAELDIAIAMADHAGDELIAHRMLINRGLVRVDLDDLAGAEADLVLAQRIGERLDQRVTLGLIAENRGLVATLLGDAPAALAHFDRAEEIISTYAALGGIHRDRAALLLSVGLVSEMRPVAERAIAAFRRQGRQHMVPEMWLLLAEAAHVDRNWTEALRYARRAWREFGRQGRADRVDRARLEVLRAQLAAGQRPRLPMDEMRAIVDSMTRTEYPGVVVEVRLVAARVALARGHRDAGLDHLRQARRRARRGSAVVRARGWYAEALLRLHGGEPGRAATAAKAGLGVLSEYSAAMGAADLRAHSSVHRAELAELGLRVALDTGRPAAVFEWAELGRASQLLHPPARPPADAELATLLSRLRATVRQLEAADGSRRRATVRQPDAGDGRAAGTDGLRRRQAELERRIRDHTRLRPGSGPADLSGMAGRPVSPRVLHAALGGWAMVEYMRLDDELHAVTLVDGEARLRRLGPVAPLVDVLARLPFALHRMAGRRSTEAHDAALTLLRDATARLDAALLGPLPELRDRPLLVVPTAPLHSLPWAILPSCAGRPVAVSPSATLWHKTSTAPLPDRPRRTVGVAAGPGLHGAREEAEAVAAIHGATALTGDAATVGAVLDALAAADLVHLAAHGRLSADNPLFSDLKLADGPLVVYDLDHVPATPGTVVLAACDSGRSVVRTGDELLGLCERENTSIAGIMRRNERAWRSDAQIDAGLLKIWEVMQACVKRG